MSDLLTQIKADVKEVFLDSSKGFALSALYDSTIDGTKNVSVIFESEGVVINKDTGDIIAEGPTVTVATADCPNLAPGATFEIEDEVYEVEQVQDDRHGMKVALVHPKRV